MQDGLSYISQNLSKTIKSFKDDPNFEQLTDALIRSAMLLMIDMTADDMRTSASVTARYFSDSSAADTLNPTISTAYSFASECISTDILELPLPSERMTGKIY